MESSRCTSSSAHKPDRQHYPRIGKAFATKLHNWLTELKAHFLHVRAALSCILPTACAVAMLECAYNGKQHVMRNLCPRNYEKLAARSVAS